MRAKRTIPAEYDGRDVEIGFNAQYLLDFLRAVHEEQVAFRFKDPQQRRRIAASRRQRRLNVPVCRHADAHLSDSTAAWNG